MKHEELLERIKPYKKHNLFTATYDIDEYGCVIGISSKAKWLPMVFEGHSCGFGSFTPNTRGDIIALILYDEENQFFPVISFLTKEEARKLAHDLLKVIGEEVDSDGD